jgi:virulence-associated protein VapD
MEGISMLTYIENEEDYAANRDKIKTGDIIAFSGTGFFGRLIRRFTGQTYSHVGIAWVISGRVFIVEALDGRGVVMRPLSITLPFYRIESKSDFTEIHEEYMLSKVGKAYSYIDAILAGLGIKPKSSDVYQCAEFIADVYGIRDEVPQFTPGELVLHFLRKD